MLFHRLVQDQQSLWDQYLHHPFVRQIKSQTLPYENFLFYLKQDYLYLIHYARCFAKLAFNATNIDELRFAHEQQNAILNAEITLHQDLLKHSNFLDNEESLTNIAYSRYMLDIGNQGDYLDLLVALSACSIGYACIGWEMSLEFNSKDLSNHLYGQWIQTYSSQETQIQRKKFESFINSYQVDEKKYSRLSQIFKTVTRLEIAFWQHALEMRME